MAFEIRAIFISLGLAGSRRSVAGLMLRRILTGIKERLQMSEEHGRGWTRTSRVIRARPEELYAAFRDPTAPIG